jgi:hypothetical protein
MSSQQLLKETQRAAGDENLSAWHQTLIDSGKELKGLQDVRSCYRIPCVSSYFLPSFLLRLFTSNNTFEFVKSHFSYNHTLLSRSYILYIPFLCLDRGS